MGCDPPFATGWFKKYKVVPSLTMILEWGVTPLLKSLFPNPQQQQEQQQEQEVKRRPLLDLSATAAGKKMRAQYVFG